MPHAPREAARAGLRAAREAGAEALISLGGSSPVDVTKGIALLAGTGRDFRDLPGHPRPGATPTLPLIHITTTLSCSEFTNVVGITNEETGEKELWFDSGMLSRYVIIDGELTRYTPEALWLSTGVKALDTTIDIFLQHLDEQPFWDPMSLRAAAGLVDLLPRSKQMPEDLAIRQRLQIAAWMGVFPRFHLPADKSARAATWWFGAAVRHQLGGMFRVPHGELAGIILREALVFHLSESRAREGALAAALVFGSPEEMHAWIPRMVAELGLPTRLREVGVGRAQLPTVVDHIVKEVPALERRKSEVAAALERMY
jgi:alcohol dehydrogenase class IV